MESIHVLQRVRPSRYAFIVDEHDFDAALQAVSLNTALWGGVYNPIVPLTPAASQQGLLKAFDPDILVNLTGADLPVDLVKRCQGRILDATALVQTDGRTNWRQLSLGFSILHILRHIHEKEVRFLSGLSRAKIAAPESAPGWPEFCAFAFGSFRWLPETGANFDETFCHALRAEKVHIPNLQPPASYEESLFPVHITGYRLRCFNRIASFSSHIIFIGDHRNLGDLIELWNIRATGRTVIFVPVAAYQAFESLILLLATQGRYPINQHVENRADLQKGPSVSDELFEQVRNWVAGRGLTQILPRPWRPRFGLEIDGYCGDIHVADIEAAKGDEISILQDSAMTPVRVIAPPYLGDEAPAMGELTWSVEITMAGGGFRNNDFMFSLPQTPAVESLVERNFLGIAMAGFRIGRRGVVLQQSSISSSFHLLPVATRDAFHAIFREVGLEVEASEPGQYAEKIIKKMGSLHGDCRVFKIRGVREILDKLGNGSCLQRGNMCAIVMSAARDEYGKNWRPELYNDLILRSGQHSPLQFGSIFDVLLEKRILRPGFEFKCSNCFKKDWYHISEFAEDYTCRFCFTPQRVNFASAPNWQYKADGLFRIPDSAQGSVAVILSLWLFENLTGIGRFVTSRNLRATDTGKRCEIDYAYLAMGGTFDTSYELVLGQATRFGDFTDNDMRLMAEIADRFPKRPYIAFSTLRDRYSEEDKARLRDLAKQGYGVIALTREELDRHDLRGLFALSPHNYARKFRELCENTLQLNVNA